MIVTMLFYGKVIEIRFTDLYESGCVIGYTDTLISVNTCLTITNILLTHFVKV